MRGKGADIFFSHVAEAPANGEAHVAVAAKAASKYTAKATFYFTPQQLLDMEQMRLTLITRYGLKADKSEIMRMALEYLIEDLDRQQHNSLLVKRLQ